MLPSAILAPVFAQVLLTFALMFWMGARRWGDITSKRVKAREIALREPGWPEPTRQVANAFSNQFELPVIFYALVILLLVFNRVTALDIIAAWVFVAGRVLHSLVQTLTDNVPLRGQVFLINFLAVVVLTGHVAWLALQGVGN